ncbi:MAG TPA: response regulator [Thermoanaerobaculia bacterium]
MTDSRECVFVVDDEPAVRRALSRLLGAAGFNVFDFASPEEFLRHLPPDAEGCATLDVHMPGLDGFAVQRELAVRGISLPIVFLTGHGDIPKSVRAIKDGAVDFLTKPVDADQLIRAVRQALDADRAQRTASAEIVEIRRRLETLTARERQVLDGVVEGRLNKQIGGELGIAEKTVKVHRGRVMEKMAAGSLAELVHLAGLAGIRRP